MFNHVQSIFVIFCVLGFRICASQNFGPYKIILETVKNCQEKGTGDISIKSTAITKEDGEIYHNGELKMGIPFGDSIKAVGDASIWKENQWKPIGLIWKMTFNKACSGIKNMASLWFDILKAADVEPLDCPIPEGTYNFKDYHVDKIDGLKSLKYGRYRVRLHSYLKSKKIGCLCYIARVVKA